VPPAQRYPRPYRPDGPCETQQAPDLRSNPGPVPTPTKVNLDSPQVQAGSAKATAKAVEWLRKLLAQDGGSDAKLKVSSTPIKSLSDIGTGH